MRIRTHKKKDFTIISNSTAQDINLDLEELGFLTRCLSMPEEWEFHTNFIWKNWRVGRDRVRDIFNRLIQKNRCIRVVEKSEKNKNLNNGFSYEIFDEPYTCKKRVEELESEGFIVQHSGNFDDFKKCFRSPENQGSEDEDPETQGAYKETQDSSIVPIEESCLEEEKNIKGNVLDDEQTLPATQRDFDSGNGKKSKFPLKREQVPIFQLLKGCNLECDDDTLNVLVRKYPEQKVKDAVYHLNVEIEKGTNFRNGKIAFLRHLLSGKASVVNELVVYNQKFAKIIKDKMNWASLTIHEKYCICETSLKEVPFTLPKEEFTKQMESLYKLSKNY